MFLIERIQQLVVRLREDSRGVTTVEYAVMLALVAIAVATSSPGMRDAVVDVFVQVSDALATAGGGGGGTP